MSTNLPNLANVDTDWALLQLAHAKVPEEARNAWRELLLRYDRPIFRFVQKTVGDSEATEEICQQFWYRFLQGGFAHAKPERGRFRSLLAATLIHLVADYYRERKNRKPLTLDNIPADEPSLLDHFTREHIAWWRKELLDRTWKTLQDEDLLSGQARAQVLQVEIDNENESSPEKAARLGQRLTRQVTADNYRQMLHRARKRFAALLITEVQRSLIDPSESSLTEELSELDLMRYVEIAF